MKKRKPFFLQKLDTKEFLSFIRSLIEVLNNAELEAQANQLSILASAADDAFSRSKRNPFVEQQQELVQMIRREDSYLRSAFMHSREDCEEGYRVYCDLLKGQKRWGMYKYIKAVELFLAGLEDLEFDDEIAGSISTMRILVSRFQSIEGKKIEARDEMKAAKKGAKYRDELYQMVLLIGAQFMVEDATKDSNLCSSFNNLLVQFHAIFLQRKAEEETESEVNTEASVG